MKSQIFIPLICLLVGISASVKAQSDSVINEAQVSVSKPDTIKALSGIQVQEKPTIRYNIIKLNLTPLLLKSYSLQYERILNRKFSAAIQFRMMPQTSLPFKSSILKLVDDEDADTKKIINEFKMINYAITPEVRIYLSRKGFGRGFYIAPFYRYASFSSSELNVFYTDENDAEQSIKMNGKLTANTFGLAFGVQSMLGKRVVLDWSLFGPHYGNGKGEFTGKSTHPLSADEQQDLRDQLEGIDIPLTNKTVNVTNDGASLKLDGPWGGWRCTIGIGVRF